MLKQKNESPIDVALQVCIIYAVVNGHLNTVPVAKVADFEQRLYEKMNNYPDVLAGIRDTGLMSAEAEKILVSSIGSLLPEFAEA